MKKRIEFIFIGLLLCLLLPTPAFAQEILGEEDQTPMNVTIVESPIKLEKVTAPTFGTYQKSAHEQEIQATSDLLIAVRDQRENKKSPWQLTYQLSTFTNGQEYQVKVLLGRGKLSTNQSGEVVQATPQKIAADPNEAGTILEAYSSQSTEYYYQIDKQKIHLELPADLPTGEFVGKQLVTLLNTPEID
ncbi:hypothetical protein ACFFRT_11730 [Enterococcus thailandicus]|uniref:WxL domain-containing protein n=1 Tax=Enterococcus thailandicus TaxID=417368 RepID=A0A510WEK7_ENTTH|nr:hypothetical protein [Enterococcus thailandicus]GEK37612.1 hypothetical protein ETH01_18990 [Enterococcus thailandicus]